ncbi:xylose isomerase [Microtetraspora sp. NBRC 13810]|uniref:metabolite traffic protein EboE n=1 Tax=Microtetraspora sp. NBRC 13810 TaxID=3030990 RepID=UPI0024A1CEA2|nr:metabolite traffic protein EboE [Microtetraspora sp. NBRC 13810]GLW07151.1 xylose isomerase [Microtetraspora sp. NBRC 13810]
MRLRHPDGSIVHLAYCTNVHPAEDLPGIRGQLSGFAARVRGLLSADRLGVGLWLPHDAARALLDDHAELVRLRSLLDDLGLEVVTLNGFPYRGFHQEVVKYRVYSPDWACADRLRYTLDLAEILAALLPDDIDEGTISSLPLAWRTGWTPGKAAVVAGMLDQAALGLRALAERTGKVVRLALEPEPGCIVETTAQAAHHLRGVDRDFVGVCLDACHLAVGFERARIELDLPIVKLQASCALEAPAGSQAALSAFAEPRFLHQARSASGSVDDLDEALAGGLPADEDWRVHFHMPLHATPPPPLTTTSPYLRELLGTLFGGRTPATRHVEVETYTWSVLPGGAPDLAEGIAAELDWTRRELAALGLKEL